MKRKSFLFSALISKIPECDPEHFLHQIDKDPVEVICRLIFCKFISYGTKRACRENQRGERYIETKQVQT